MNVYASTYRAVKTATVLDNADLTGREYVDTQVKLAHVAYEAYDRLRAAAQARTGTAAHRQKEAMAAAFVELALQLHTTHTDTGSKVAAHPDHLAPLLPKLAAAVVVDELLLEQLPTLEGGTKRAALQCQLLGREYAMSLIGEILP